MAKPRPIAVAPAPPPVLDPILDPISVSDPISDPIVTDAPAVDTSVTAPEPPDAAVPPAADGESDDGDGSAPVPTPSPVGISLAGLVPTGYVIGWYEHMIDSVPDHNGVTSKLRVHTLGLVSVGDR